MSDAIWVDIIPNLKQFGGPLTKKATDEGRRAGRAAGAALADGVNSGASAADLSPVVKELQDVEAAARKSAETQAKEAERAAAGVKTAEKTIYSARQQRRTATDAVNRAEVDLSKKQATAADRASELQLAEAKLERVREDSSSTADQLAKAEAEVEKKRRAVEVAEKAAEASAAKLEGARERQADTNEKVADAEEQIRAAVTESKVAQEAAELAAKDHAKAQQDLARETEKAAQKATQSVPLWRRMWQGISDPSAIKGGLNKGFGFLKTQFAKEATRFKASGEKLLSGVWKGIKLGAGSIAAGGAALFGGAIVGGFKRLSNIEQAKAKLEGLGHSGKAVESIMDNALASVKGTAYGMDEAAGLAGTLVASGIKPGQDLERVLKLTADSATIAGRDLGEMGLIWSSVAAKGKLQGDDAQQLLAAGIPIWEMVADVMGTTAAEAQELGSKGKVGFDVFAQAMEKGVGGAALKSGNTTAGAFANMKAAVSRFGAELLKNVFPLIGPMLKQFTTWVDDATKVVGPLAEAFSSKLGGALKAVGDAWGKFTSGALTQDVVKALGLDPSSGLGFALGEVIGGIRAFSAAWTAFDGEITSSGFPGLMEQLAFNVRTLWENIVVPMGNWMRDNLVPILAGVGGALAYLAGGTLVGALASLWGVVAAGAAAIGWIPLAIAGVVTALTWFFTKTEGGRRIVSVAFTAMKTAAATLMDWWVDVAAPASLNALDWLMTGFSWMRTVVGGVFSWLASTAATVFTGVVIPAFQQAAGFVQNTLAPILLRLWTDYAQPALTAIGGAALWLWTNALGPALSAVAGFIRGNLGPTIVWMWQNVFSPAFSAIGSIVSFAFNSVIFPVLDFFKNTIIGNIGPAALWLWRNVMVPAWTGIRIAVAVAVAAVMTVLQVLVSLWRGVVAPVAMWLWRNILAPAFAGIAAAVRSAVGVATAVLNSLVWLWRNVLAPAAMWLWRNVLAPAWAGIQAAVQRFTSWFQSSAWPVIQRVIQWVTSAFQTMRSALGRVWSEIQHRVVQPVVSFFTGTVQPKLKRVADSVTGFFKGMKDGVGKHWNALRGLVGKPVDFVINRVINDGFVSNFNKVAGAIGLSKDKRLPTISWKFATGGIVPGYTPGRDVHHFVSPTGGALSLSGGEPILRPEAGRVLGSSWVHGINAAARTGGTAGVSQFLGRHQAFAGGGFIDWTKEQGSKAWKWGKKKVEQGVDIAGDVIDDIKGFASAVLEDPLKALAALVQPLVSQIPGSAMMKDVGGAGVGWAVKHVADWVKRLAAPSMAESGSVPPLGAARAGGSLGMAQRIAASYGLRMTSFRRPGARTAGSGSVSMHSLGRAMDFSNSTGPTPQMMAFFNHMHPYRPTELLYSPAGPRQWRRGGRMADTSGAVRRLHYNHVHVAFDKGGVFAMPREHRTFGLAGQLPLGASIISQQALQPMLYDQGGWVPPGLTLVNNASGKPEALYNAADQARIRRLVENSATQGTQVHVPITATQLSEADVDRLADEIMRRIALAMEGDLV